MVMEYRAARLAGELAKDIATGGTTEEADAFPIITFHDWLIQTRNPDHR